MSKERYQNIPSLLKVEAHTLWQTIHSNALDAAQKNVSHCKAQIKQAAATYFQKRNFLFYITVEAPFWKAWQ